MINPEKKASRSAGVKSKALKLARMSRYSTSIASGKARNRHDSSSPVSLEEAEYYETYIAHGRDLETIAELDRTTPAATFEEVTAPNGVVSGKVTYSHECMLRLVHNLTLPFEDAELYFQSHASNPLQACCQEALSQIDRFGLKDDLLTGGVKEKRESVNKFNFLISDIQKRMKAEWVRRSLRNYRRNSQQRYKKLVDITKDIFAKHSRVLSVRVDFAYSRAALDGAGSCPPPSAQEAAEHRKNMVDYITKKYEDGLAMYAWSMECGLISGVHFHFWLLLKGSDHRDDFGVAEHLGKHWMNEVTEGRGRYFNCSGVKSSYLVCGLGMLHRDSLEAMEGVKIIARYITKLDFHLRYEQIGIRTFGRSDDRRINKKRRASIIAPKGL